MAYNFNGTNQYLTVGSSPVLAVPITIACWIRGNGAPAAGQFWPLVVISNNPSNDRVNIAISDNNRVTCAYVDDGIFGATASSATNEYISENWLHVCAVHESSSSREIYVSGISKNKETSMIASLSQFNRIAIGSNHIASAFFNGRIADVGIWNVALSAAEIASLSKGMTCNKIRPQNLVFYAPLIRNLQDTKGGLIITPVNNPIVAEHPRVYA